VPPELERVISRCLRKDPNRRFQLADELKIALEDLKGESDSDRHAPTAPAARRRRWLPWVAAGTAAVAAILAVTFWLVLPFSPPAEPSPRLVPVTTFQGSETTPSFSPDGNQVAFAWDGEDQQNRDIYVKMLGSQGLSRLTTHPGFDASPVWSPDGRWIAFCRFSPPPDSNHFSLVVIPAIGGPPSGCCGKGRCPANQTRRTSSVGLGMGNGSSVPTSKHRNSPLSPFSQRPPLRSGRFPLRPSARGYPRLLRCLRIRRVCFLAWKLAISPMRTSAFFHCRLIFALQGAFARWDYMAAVRLGRLTDLALSTIQMTASDLAC
ncbi:MAG: hypothetical protein EHM61_24025, partial [Acidobacteria bacterium]